MTYEEALELIQEHLDYGGSLDSHGLAVAMSDLPASIADTATTSHKVEIDPLAPGYSLIADTAGAVTYAIDALRHAQFCIACERASCDADEKEQWDRYQHAINGLTASVQVIADTAGASEDARDAARYRYLRNAVGVILDCSHAGPWKFGEAIDKQVDEWLERNAAIAKESGND